MPEIMVRATTLELIAYRFLREATAQGYGARPSEAHLRDMLPTNREA
jgi:hypothetical protein